MEGKEISRSLKCFRSMTYFLYARIHNVLEWKLRVTIGWLLRSPVIEVSNSVSLLSLYWLQNISPWSVLVWAVYTHKQFLSNSQTSPILCALLTMWEFLQPHGRGWYMQVFLKQQGLGVPCVYIGLLGSSWKVPGAFLTHNQALYGHRAQLSTLSLSPYILQNIFMV